MITLDFGVLGRNVIEVTDPVPLDVLERRTLMGRGIGFIDVHLRASAALAAPAQLWTRDRRLAAIALELRLAYRKEIFWRGLRTPDSRGRATSSSDFRVDALSRFLSSLSS